MNPMLQMLNTNSNVSNVKNMMNLLRSSNNPQALLNNMLATNPQMKQVMDYVNQNGGNPQQAFYKMAQEKGVDPNAILNMLK